MRLSKSWIITAKDFKTFRKKRSIVYALVAVPLIIAILIPGIIHFAGHRNGANGIAATELTVLLPAFAFFYIILAAYLPTPIASYTLVGEKMEKSLEPLLATPTTDSEILLGKGLAAWLPSLASVVFGSIVFMALMDLVTHGTLGYYYFPNWDTALVLFVMAPLAALLSVEVNVIVSSRVTDVRSGQQLGVFTIAPFAAMYVAGELGIVNLGDTNTLLAITGAILVVDVLFFYITKATFRREEILTRWK